MPKAVTMAALVPCLTMMTCKMLGLEIKTATATIMTGLGSLQYTVVKATSKSNHRVNLFSNRKIKHNRT